MNKLKLVLDWALPILCLVNMFLYWGNDNTFTAWVVAFAGWSSNLVSRYKNNNQTS